MPIRPLAEIVVEHPYFASGTFTEARLAPDAATEAKLRGLRLVAKRHGGGLAVLVELDAGGVPRVPLTPTRLRFLLLRLPADLEQATDLAPLRPGATFNDDGVGPGDRLRLVVRETRAQEALEKPAGAATIVLSGRPIAGTAAAAITVLPPAEVRVTGYDQASNRISVDGPAGRFALAYPMKPPPAGEAIAAVEIAIGPETAAAAAAGTPRRCVVALKPTAARWCYHLVTNLPTPLAEWRIARANGADGPAVGFADAGRAEIVAATPDDPFGSELWRRSTPARVLRFVSDAPVPCSERVARRIALFAGATQLFSALPNPSPAHPKRVGGEAAFGEVLRLMTV